MTLPLAAGSQAIGHWRIERWKMLNDSQASEFSGISVFRAFGFLRYQGYRSRQVLPVERFVGYDVRL